MLVQGLGLGLGSGGLRSGGLEVWGSRVQWSVGLGLGSRSRSRV
jgi:hypothetical protein